MRGGVDFVSGLWKRNQVRGRGSGAVRGYVRRRREGGSVRNAARRTQLTPEKRKPEKEKRKKERKTVRVNRATRKVFWKKYSFRAKRGKEDFFQKPEGLDLAVGAA